MRDFLETIYRYLQTPIVDDDFPEMKHHFQKAFFRLYDNCPPVVCLCGSTRFYEAFQKANYEETMQGKIVLSVGFYPHSSEKAHGQTLGCDDAQKKALDALHFRKIELADEILVLNVGGYIGESTRNEIEYAKGLGKTIRYLESQPGESNANS